MTIRGLHIISFNPGYLDPVSPTASRASVVSPHVESHNCTHHAAFGEPCGTNSTLDSAKGPRANLSSFSPTFTEGLRGKQRIPTRESKSAGTNLTVELVRNSRSCAVHFTTCGGWFLYGDCDASTPLCSLDNAKSRTAKYTESMVSETTSVASRGFLEWR